MGERIKINLLKKGEKQLSDPKGGSDPKPPETPPNTTAQLSIDQLAAEKAALEIKVSEMQKTLDELMAQLKAANDVLEAQNREKFIKDILPRSKFTVEDLNAKSLEELKEIRATLDQAVLPKYKNIHFPPVAGDQNTDRDTVGDLSVVAEAKRKAGRN